jgi:hypothetical protein
VEESVRVRHARGKPQKLILVANEYLSVRQIHIDKAGAPETTASSLKLMHRFKEDDVLKLMDAAAQS